MVLPFIIFKVALVWRAAGFLPPRLTMVKIWCLFNGVYLMAFIE